MMTPRERFLASVLGAPVDRVPLRLEGLHVASREALAQVPDPLHRDVADRIYAQTHWRHRHPTGISRWLVTPPQAVRKTGTEPAGDGTVTTFAIETPRGPLVARTGQKPGSRTTWTVKYPVESLADIDRIQSAPWALPHGLRPPSAADAPGDFAERGIREIGVSSPMVCVAGMMPYEYFLELCATEFGLIRELTDLCLARILAILDVVLAERAVEYVWLGGCEWLTPPMGSPRLYEDLVQGQEATVIRRVHAAGALCHVHCHGRVRSTLERVIERGADLFEPVEPPPDGDLPFAEAKALARGRLTLAGNVEARVLEKGDAADVERAARQAFEGGTHRMILSSTAGPICAFDERMHRNYHRLVDVWEELSAN